MIDQVDAFTSEPFQGNPAAVVLLSETAFHRDGAADWMLHVARENNLSETAFAALRSNQEAGEAVEYDLKWFTPAAEVALCGHATLSTAVVLLDGGHVDPTQTIHFHTLYVHHHCRALHRVCSHSFSLSQERRPRRSLRANQDG